MSNMVVSLLLKVREEGVAAIGKFRDGLVEMGGVGETLAPSFAAMGGHVVHAAHAMRELTVAFGEASARGRELFDTAIHGSVGVAAAVYGFKKGFLDIALEEEQIMLRLAGLEQSPARAQAAIGWIKDFREHTAATLAEVTNAWIELREHGVDPTKGAMKAIADTAAVTGASMEDVARKLGNAAQEAGEGRVRELGLEMHDLGGRIAVTYRHAGNIITETFSKLDKSGLQANLVRILNLLHSGAAQKAADSYAGSMAKLGEAWRKFAMEVMDKGGVLKTLTEALKEITGQTEETAEGQKSNAQVFAGALKEMIVGLKNAVLWLEVNLPKIILLIENFTRAVGGPEVVLGALAAALAAPLVTSLVKLGVVLVGTVIPAIYSLSAALLATPAGWIIAAFALLVLAAYELYKHWDEVIGFLDQQWFEFSTTLVQILQGLAQPLIAAFQDIKAWAEHAWDAITQSDAAQWLMQQWQPVKAFFEDLWKAIKWGYDNSIGPIVDTVRSVLPSMNTLTSPWNNKQAADDVLSGRVQPPEVSGTLKVDIHVDSEGKASATIRQNDTSGGLNVDPSLGFGMAF